MRFEICPKVVRLMYYATNTFADTCLTALKSAILRRQYLRLRFLEMPLPSTALGEARPIERTQPSADLPQMISSTCPAIVTWKGPGSSAKGLRGFKVSSSCHRILASAL